MATRDKVTIGRFRAWKRERRKFAVLTCYDYSTARLMELAEVDAILVGDTYGEVCLGHDTTLPVTVDHLVTVTAGVRRGAPTAFLIGDLPYLSYQVCEEDAIRNAGRFMAEAGCDCVKIEVDRRLSATVEAMSRATIPVMAHLGLRPQSVHQIGGYRAQGKTAEAGEAIIRDAKIMEDAGAVALLLEAVPREIGKIVSENTALPVVGCIAGPNCDGQVIVMHDMLGYGGGHPPRGIKTYANLQETLTQAFAAYVSDVHADRLWADSENISMSSQETDRLRQMLGHS